MPLTPLETRMQAAAQQQLVRQSVDVAHLEESIKQMQTKLEKSLQNIAQALQALTTSKDQLSRIDNITARLEDQESSLFAHRLMAQDKTQLLGRGKQNRLAWEVTSSEHLETVTEQHRQVMEDLALARARRSVLLQAHESDKRMHGRVLWEHARCEELLSIFEGHLEIARDRHRALLVVVDADNLLGYEAGAGKISRDGDATVMFVANHVQMLASSLVPNERLQFSSPYLFDHLD